jgi:hypothetical protein
MAIICPLLKREINPSRISQATPALDGIFCKLGLVLDNLPVAVTAAL